MTDVGREAALEQIADEVRVCTRCRLHQQRTRPVPGEGNADTEVVFVGEGPGFNEDREGRPFVGRAGALLVRLLASVGWRREDVFITNVVKCRPPENRDPMPDEIAACAPFLRRQLAALDPALVVTLGRHSMGTFMPDARISQAHGTMRPVAPATGAADALVYAMYHPAAALRSTDIEQASMRDMAGVPSALLRARERRARHAAEAGAPVAASGGPAAASGGPAAAEGSAWEPAPTGSETHTQAAEPAPTGAPSSVEASDAPAGRRPDGPQAETSRVETRPAPVTHAPDSGTASPAAHAVPATLADREAPTDQLTLF